MNEPQKNGMSDVDRYYQCYLETKNNIEKDRKTLEGKIDYVNPFWQGIIGGRKNFSEFNDLMSFFRGNMASGIGSCREDIEDERRSFEGTAITALKEVPFDFIRSIDEPLIGFPLFFKYKSVVASDSFLNNLIGTYRIISFFKRFSNKKNINVLEIGAGWGGVAYQLLKSLDINNYAVCDLHENLFISSFFLQATCPQKKPIFVMNDQVRPAGNSLVFCSPAKLGKIEGEFDLIINMQSFQEMYIKDVQEYAKYAHQHLAQGGMVYSENGIDSLDSKEQRTKKFSDYGLHDKFDLVSLEHGKRFCPNMFCGNKHEAVFIKKSGDQGKSAKYNPVYLDAICYLFNLRLDEDVKGIRESYLNNKSSDKEIKLLELVYSFFDTTDVEKKRNVANSMNGLGYVVISSFLTAMLLIAENKYLDSTFHLENALKNGLSGLARANALLFLSLVQKQQGTAVDEARVVKEIVATAPQMEEISALIIKKYRADKLSYRIARQINVIKPKIFGHILPRIKEELPRRAFSYLSRKPAHEIPYCLN